MWIVDAAAEDAALKNADEESGSMPRPNLKDKEWITGEIQKQIQLTIRESLAEHSNRKLTQLKSWSPLGAFVAICLFTLLQWNGYTVFKVQTEVRLSNIETSVLALRTSQAATKPENERGQVEAKLALAEARKSSIALPQSVVVGAGKSFIEASLTEPKAWNVALDFVAYRSSLNKEPTTKLALRKDLGIFGWPANFPGTHLTIGAYGYADKDASAISEQISAPKNYTVIKLAPPQYLTSSGQPQKAVVELDGMRLRHVIFKDLEIIYRGGSLKMEDVRFVNCSFKIDRHSPGLLLAEHILLAGPTSFQFSI